MADAVGGKIPAPVQDGLYELFESRMISDDAMNDMEELARDKYEAFPERVTGVTSWALLLRGRQTGFNNISKPLQASAAGMSKDELALCQKLCFGHTHSSAVLAGAYHEDRYVDEDPEFRAKVHKTFDEIDRNGDHHITYMELLRWWKNANKADGGGKLTGEMIQNASAKFHEFDTNGNGTIDKDELAGLIKALDLESLLGEAEGELDEGRTWEEGELAILSAVGCKLIGLPVKTLQQRHDKEYKKLNKKFYGGAVPKAPVRKQGWLGKTAGEKVNSKVHVRWFTLGDGMMAYYDLDGGEEPAEGEVPSQEDCKGCIVFGPSVQATLGEPELDKEGNVETSRGRTEYNVPIMIKTAVANNKGKSNFMLLAKDAGEQIDWCRAISNDTPDTPEVLITADEEFGGNFVDITFTDLSDPGPDAIIFQGSDSTDVHISGVTEGENRVLKDVRQGQMLIEVDGVNPASNVDTPFEDVVASMQTTQRPFKIRLYEPAEIEVIFVKEEATGLVFNGQDGGRNFNVVSVASGSEANEHSELRPGLMLKKFNGKDVSMLPAEQLADMVQAPARPLTMTFVPHAYMDVTNPADNEEPELVEDTEEFPDEEGEPEPEPEPEEEMDPVLAAAAAAETSKKKKKKKNGKQHFHTGSMLFDGMEVHFRVAEFGAQSYEPLPKSKQLKQGVAPHDIYETPVVRASPANAKTELTNAGDCEGCWVLVNRGDCSYGVKAINCEAAGALGCIIINTEDKLMVPTDKKDEAGDVTIPVVFIASSRLESAEPQKATVLFERGTKAKSMRGQMLAIKYSKVYTEVAWRYKEQYEDIARDKYHIYQAKKLAHRLGKQLGLHLGEHHESLSEAFKAFDQDGGGTITVEEMVKGFTQYEVAVTEEQIRTILDTIDDDGDATVNYQEFLSAFEPDMPEEEPAPELEPEPEA